MDMWETYCRRKSENDLPEDLSTTLRDVNLMKDTSPICAALNILGTVPVTTCECKRSNSTLKQMKDYKRSTIGKERLNGLALMCIHRSVPLNFDRIISVFAAKNPRRMQLRM
eukprot:gene5756-11029_t